MTSFISMLLSGVAVLHTTLVKTPVFSFLPNIKLHHIVILSLNTYTTHIHSNIINDIYIIDYTPQEDINFKTGLQLLLGRTIKGHIRIVHMNKINTSTIINDWYNETKLNILSHIDDQRINNIIMKWDSNFKFLSHNCQHFARYFIKEIDTLSTK